MDDNNHFRNNRRHGPPISPKTGLSSAEAAKLLKQYGQNVVFKKRRIKPLIALIKKFSSPLLIILIFSSVVSFFLGEHTNAIIIFLMILASGILDFINTYKSEKAVRKLVQRVATTVTVFRDGRKKEIVLNQIVPGDRVYLAAGDIVPADCLVLTADDLFVNQSSLTGESFPVEKTSIEGKEEEAAADNQHLVFMGTSVISGFAEVVVQKTGSHTQFGKIAEKLSETPPETDFEIGIRKYSYFMLRLTFIMVSFVFLANAVFGKQGWLESFIFALAIAIGLAPELLPVMMSVALSHGSVRMAKKDVIVKNLSSIHNLGSMNILCTDKTGTLTQDKIVLIRNIDGFGNNFEKVAFNAYVSSVHHTGIRRPLETAIKEYKKFDITGYRKIDEVPFDFNRKRDSVVVEKEGRRVLITKGAPEEIFKISKFYEKNGADSQTFAFDAPSKSAFEKKFDELSADGFRVLAIATRAVESGRSVYHRDEEKDMTFLGFMAFFDPPKEGVKEAIDALKNLGIEIKIVTGDNDLLARRICEEIGLVCGDVLTGDDLRDLNDAQLANAAKTATIFARVAPEEKERIILVLKKAGNSVGYLGDGINDAPALRVADVGISVNNAVDVAKESADIILIQKSLQVIRDGVEEGRKTFQNIMKYIMMGLSSDFGNMFSMMGASLFLPFLPMLPPQVLFNDFLYDVSQLSLPTDAVDEDEIKRPPKWNFKFIRNFMLVMGPVSSLFDFLTFAALIFVFRFNESQFQTGWFMESIATQVFVVYIIRTKKIPFLQSWPSRLLFGNALFAVLAAWLIPYSPLGKLFKFSPLPFATVTAIFGIMLIYLVLAELVKRYFYSKFGRDHNNHR